MARPAYSLPERYARYIHGIERRVETARTDVHIMVNLICHLGSTAYELQVVSSITPVQGSSLVDLILCGYGRYPSLSEDSR
jgi:hypothetical protein